MSKLRIPSATGWRDCRNAREFSDHFKLSDRIAQLLPDTDSDFQPVMLELMRLYFNQLRNLLHESDFDWNYVDAESGMTTEDELVTLYAVLIEATQLTSPLKQFIPQYKSILQQRIPTKSATKSAKQRSEQERNYTLLQNAFHRPEAGPRNVAKPVYDQIVEYYRQYDDSIYGSPYTSIVGPSGIGKSFAMQSIARQGLAYVIYVSLAEPSSTAYPRRSLLADSMTRHGPEYTSDKVRAGITTFFECYIAASMVHVQLCKKYRIHPLEFFNLQVCQEYQSYYQTEIKEAIEELAISVWKAYSDS
ncbi:hypothetical protein V8E54_014512 [Elaphomyces granulatus]